MKEAIPEQRLNPLFQHFEPSPTLALNELCLQLVAEKKTVYRFGFGQSPFPIPESVVAGLRQHAEEKAYLPVQGLPSLRKIVARFHNETLGGHWSENEVLIGPGSKELMYLLQMVLDTDLALPSPSWVSYVPQAKMLRRQVYWMPTDLKDRYLLNPETLDRTLSNSQKRLLVVLNTPSNPTGTAYSDLQLQELANVLRRHRALVLSDEIYGQLHFDGKHASISKHYPEGTIVSTGLSKWCAAGGWRLGVMLFPPNSPRLLKAILAAGSETFSATCAPVQYAAQTAYAYPADVEEYGEHCRSLLKHIGCWVANALAQAGVATPIPDGGFYLFPDFSKVSKANSSQEFCEALLKATGVALLPGSAFGRPESELTARLSYVDFDGKRALQAATHTGLGEDFLRSYCGKVVEGVCKLISWLAACNANNGTLPPSG